MSIPRVNVQSAFHEGIRRVHTFPRGPRTGSDNAELVLNQPARMWDHYDGRKSMLEGCVMWAERPITEPDKRASEPLPDLAFGFTRNLSRT